MARAKRPPPCSWCDDGSTAISSVMPRVTRRSTNPIAGWSNCMWAGQRREPSLACIIGAICSTDFVGRLDSTGGSPRRPTARGIRSVPHRTGGNERSRRSERWSRAPFGSTPKVTAGRVQTSPRDAAITGMSTSRTSTSPRASALRNSTSSSSGTNSRACTGRYSPSAPQEKAPPARRLGLVL